MKPGSHLVLKYLLGGVVRYRAGETLGPRDLPDYELVLIIDGNVHYITDDGDYVAAPGSILFTRPGFHEVYRWDPVGLTRHAYFHFDIAEVPSVWPEFTKWPVIRPRPEPVLAALFRSVLDRICLHRDWPATSPGPLDCLIVETLLSLFLEEPRIAVADFERDRPVQVGRTILFMRETIDTDAHRRLTLEDLAKAGGVSKKHLCRSFHSTLGYSPIRTYRLLCLQLSLSLLTRSNLTIREIADRCGFEDPAYFSRSFSRVFGFPPTKMREVVRGGALPPPNPLPVDLTPRLFW